MSKKRTAVLMPPGEPIAAFAARQIETRLRIAAEACNAVHQDPAEEPVHRVRVAIRRLFAALATFAPILPTAEVEQHRKHFRPILKMAGEVRNCDIALGLAREAGLDPASLAVNRLKSERGELAVLLWRLLEPAS
ncbi:MAG: CHAD domain-containing protein [Bryobacteraceae bacterium]